MDLDFIELKKTFSLVTFVAINIIDLYLTVILPVTITKISFHPKLFANLTAGGGITSKLSQ